MLQMVLMPTTFCRVVFSKQQGPVTRAFFLKTNAQK